MEGKGADFLAMRRRMPEGVEGPWRESQVVKEGASGKVMIWGEVVDDDDDDDDVVVVAAAEGVSAAGVDVEAEVDADADAEVEAREFLGFALALVVVGGAGEGFIASTAAALTERRVLRLGMLATLSLETNVATRAPR